MVTAPPDWRLIANALADRLGRYTNCGHEAGPSAGCAACENLQLVNTYLRAELTAGASAIVTPTSPAAVSAAGRLFPPGCGLPGCLAHLDPAKAWELAAGPMPDAGCTCAGWFDASGYHIARFNPACGAHPAPEPDGDPGQHAREVGLDAAADVEQFGGPTGLGPGPRSPVERQARLNGA